MANTRGREANGGSLSSASFLRQRGKIKGLMQQAAHDLQLSSPVRTTHIRSRVMNWDQVKGNWKQFTGKVKEKWGDLTDDDLTAIEGKRDQLAGKLQERYGYAKERAEREIDDFASTLR
jgi:uncharacterized protein YjbJ (UPF0337 family)